MNDADKLKAWRLSLKATMDARDPGLWGQCSPYVDKVTDPAKLLLLVRIVAECDDVAIVKLAAELAAPEAKGV